MMPEGFLIGKAGKTFSAENRFQKPLLRAVSRLLWRRCRRGAIEYGGIGRPFGKSVLNSHEVDRRQAAEETADDGTMDICVTGQS
jgi:hypothetical protein